MTHKEKVKSLLQAVSKGDTETAARLLHSDYIQHNPFVPTGRDPFLGLVPVLVEHNTHTETVRIFQDGDYVFLHNIWHNAAPFGADTMVAFDVLRLDADGLIAEHWDSMMANTPANPSGRTLTDGETTVKDLEETDKNRALITSFIQAAIDAQPEEFEGVMDTYFHPDHIQHNPGAGDGIKGLFEALQNGGVDFVFQHSHKVLAEGNFVLSITEGTNFGRHAVFYDLFRIEDGKIAEHWDVIQDIPTENLAHDNTMFNF